MLTWIMRANNNPPLKIGKGKIVPAITTKIITNQTEQRGIILYW